MNKKKNIFWLSFAVVLILVNFLDLWYFINTFVGKISYDKWDYKGAIDWFLSIPNEVWYYNASNAYYKNEEYEKAVENYEWILWVKNKNLLFETYHNLWNSFYRIWEQKEEEKLEYFLNSVLNYEKALEIRYDEETEANRDFVLSKIKELEQEQNNNSETSSERQEADWDTSKWQEEEWDNNSETSSKQQEADWDTSEWQEGNLEQQSWSSQNWEQQALNENQNNENWEKWQSSDIEGTEKGNEENFKLSEEDKKALEEYSKALQENQNAYSDWFNKVYQEENNDFFENFFNFDPFNFDSFFDNSLLDWDNNKKDW